jgi:L-ascorbate metabolism protein UlaG (beta-lactamase superfamily)
LPGGKMKIQYLGHSSFMLIESTGKTIVTDPFANIGYEMPTTFADAVTISHKHHDHVAAKSVCGDPVIIDKEGNYQVGGVNITGIKAYHDNEQGKERGSIIIYKFRMDGLDICHLGDIGQELDLERLEQILPVNILLIPVGGKYTINAEQAKEYVDKIIPEIVIPMHYKTKSSTIDVDKVTEFTSLFEDYMVYEAENELEFSRDDMDWEVTKIMVMKRIRN